MSFGTPVRIRTRTNGSEDHCAIPYTTRAYIDKIILSYKTKFVNAIIAQ